MYTVQVNFFRVLVFSLLVGVFSALAQTETQDSTRLKKKKKKVSLTGIALPSRTPENGFNVQGGLVALFNTDKNDSLTRGSDIYLYAMYSQYRQWRISNGGDIFTKKEKYYINYWYYISYSPEQYFGFGDQVNLTSKEFVDYNVVSFTTNIFRKIKKNFFAGPSQYLESVSKVHFTKNGLMDKNPIAGSKPYTSSGIGWKIKWDNRDNIFSTRKGWLIETGIMGYGKYSGSDNSFQQYYIDIRKFTSFKKKIFANQIYVCNSVGKDMAPFRILYSVTARGYHPNLYKDNFIATYQNEFRFPIWKGFGISAFSGIAYASPNVNKWLYNAGGGIRIKIIPSYNMHMRIEYGVGNNSSAFYLSFYDQF